MAQPPQKVKELSPLKRAFLALEKAQTRLEAVERARREGIAVLGMGCRFPGGIEGPDDYWDLLSAGRDAIIEVPPSRWDIDALYDPDPTVPGKVASRFGGFIDNIDQFDATFFGISPREAESLDPQQRLLLEVTQEAFERAGLATDRLVDSNTGVFVGVANADYYCVVTRSSFEQIDAYLGTGTSPNSAAGRISYVFGLRGPCTALDTACSSSLVAIHLACQSLRNGECDMALAGGANVMLSPDLSITFSKARMLCPDGRCKTFDASADGYVRGEGVGVIVLKRLSNALADGDPILAVIRGSAMNQDGPSGGLTVPNGPSQQNVILKALSVDRIAPDSIDYVEAHGTGTALGDPIEMGALGSVFANRRDPLWVGSVKTNLGHLEGAAGIASVIKVILAMQHEAIPAHLHFKTPSPRIPWNELPIRIPTAQQPWPRGDRPRLAGASSFGFSGINAHVVLEEAPAASPDDRPRRPCHLLPLSAKHPVALRQLAQRFATQLAQEPRTALEDVCLTAGSGRSHEEYRMAVVGETAEGIRQQLNQFTLEESPLSFTSQSRIRVGKVLESAKTAFLFSGQGSQHVGMGRELFEVEPEYRIAFEACEAAARNYLQRPLREIVFSLDPDASLLDDPVAAQLSLFALEYALAQLWQSWGVRPAALLGHSLGEYAAACLAGVFSLEDGVKLVAARGRLAQTMSQDGHMVAALANVKRVEEALSGYEDVVSIAAENCPDQVVVSGRGDALEEVSARLFAAGIVTQPLGVSYAFHSPLVEPVLDEFRRVAEEITFIQPHRNLISNVTGTWATDEITRPDYWCKQVRGRIQFSSGVQRICECGIQTCLEIGPRSYLLPLARAAWNGDASHWISSLQPGVSNEQSMLDGLAQLYVAGQAVDWEQFGRAFAGQRVPAPTYPFQRHRYWIDAPTRPTTFIASTSRPLHPLLGRRVHTAAAPDFVLFEGWLTADRPPFLSEHQIMGTSLLPATAFIETALAAGREAGPDGQPLNVLEDLSIKQPMEFVRGGSRVVQVAIKPDKSEYRVEIHSADGDDPNHATPQWTLHAAGRLLSAPTENVEVVNLAELQRRCGEVVALDGFYDQLKQLGLEYGPRFRGLRQLWRGTGEVLGKIELPRQTAGEDKDYLLYPPLLDAALHASVDLFGLAAHDQQAGRATFVPVGVERVELRGSSKAAVWSHARLREESHRKEASQYIIDIDILDSAGELVVRLNGLRAQRIELSLLVPPKSAAAQRPGNRDAPPPRNIAPQLQGLSADEQRQKIVDFLEEEVVTLLKLTGHERPAHHKNLFELGMDSLMAVDFLYRVNRGLQVNLSMQTLLEKPAIGPLADRFIERLDPNAQLSGPADASLIGALMADTAPAPANAWFPHHHVEPRAQVRLFCFHPLGGHAAIFSDWPGLLRPDMEVCAVQLPGSGSRIEEAVIESWESLVETLAEQILDYLDRPFAFFGVGSGSLLAYEVAQFTQNRFGLAPVHLFAAASWAPGDVSANMVDRHADSDYPDPGFRTYPFEEKPPLDCSLTAIADSTDDRLGREQLQNWSDCTKASFQLESLAGPSPTPGVDKRLAEIVTQTLQSGNPA